MWVLCEAAFSAVNTAYTVVLGAYLQVANTVNRSWSTSDVGLQHETAVFQQLQLQHTLRPKRVYSRNVSKHVNQGSRSNISQTAEL